MIKLMKQDVNNDRVGIHTIDTRRVRDVRPKVRIVGVIPSHQVISDEPPYELEQMRSGDRWDLVPN